MSDTPERPLKRRHQASHALVRHETLYLEDGDIVLTAPSGDGQRRLVFRVDKIFLARHSPIFQDMLAFAPGGGPGDVYEGVPRVDLTDSAEDLAVLLGGMYNMATLLLPKFDSSKPLRMLGPMRLAMKYEVEGVKNIIVKDVEDDWPKTLDAYDAWRAERDRIIGACPTDPWKHAPEPAAAMQFATEFDCSQISAAIMYYLARSPVNLRLPTGPPGYQPHKVRWHLLDSRNLFRVLEAQQVFREHLKSFREVMTSQPPNCTAGDCYRTLKLIGETEICEDCDILNFCSVVPARYSQVVCPQCAAAFQGDACRKVLDKLRTALWAAMKECASSEPIPW